MDKLIKCIVDNFKLGNTDKKFTTEALQLIKEVETKVNDDIAIIGISLKTAHVENLYEYWKLIEDGVDCIREFPANRAQEVEAFVRHRYGERREYYKGAFLDDVSHFDYKFFRCTPKEASLMDPNQKLFLEIAWKALEDSGYLNDNIHKSRTGIFLGYSPSLKETYQEMINIADKSEVSTAIPFNLSSIVASRLAYFLDLKGPSMVIDSACSSGITAVDAAIKSLKKNECELAIAGGIRLHLLPVDDVDYRMGIESVDGHTRAFDGESTGSGVGEGAVALVLKRLSDARRDNDNIYAVIKGIALNQDGQSLGITAPNPDSQKDVMIQAWQNSRVDPRTIDYIETHGTATVLGDPIELNSIAKAFQNYTDDVNFCAVSSVKSNLGHLYECAGFVSIVKAVLALKNKIIPKTINYHRINKQIDFLHSPIYINTINREWKSSGHPRRCGVSAFGYSGTNAHMIIEEFREETTEMINTKKEYVVVFSAHSKVSLLRQFENYNTYREQIQAIHLKNIAWTLAYCRKHYVHRVAVIASSTEDLLNKIEAIHKKGLGLKEKWMRYSNHKIIAEARENQKDYEITLEEQENISKEASACIELDHDENRMAKLASYYCAGAEIAWDKLYGDHTVNKKVSLPSYEFDKKESWLDLRNVNASTQRIIKKGGLSSEGLEENVTQITILGKENYTDIEVAICEVLSKILGFKEVDVYDNFFELGLDSISMMKVVEAIKNKFHVSIDFKLFAQGINVSKLADIIAQSSSEQEEGKTLRYSLEDQYKEFALTSIQKAYVLGRDTYYNLGNTSTHMYMEYETELDFARLEKALNKVINKHPMLRAVIAKNLTQRILKEVPWYSIELEDLTNRSYIEGETYRKKQREVMSHRLFDTETWPLFEFKGIQTANKRYLLVGIDLLIADGMSLQILLQDLIRYYKDETLEVETTNYTFRDYIQEYIQIKNTELYQEAKEYWSERIKNIANPPELPLKIKIEDVKKPYFKRQRRNFGTGSLKRLKEVARKHGVTVSAILCTAYTETLRKWSNRQDFIVNIASYNRYDFNDQVNQLVGDFTSVLLLAVDYAPTLSFWEKVLLIQNNIIEGIGHRFFDGVEMISDILSKAGEYDKALFPVVFTSVIADNDDFDATFFGREVFGSNQTPQVYLDNQARAYNGEFIMVWDYIEQLLDCKMVAEMFDYHNSILDAVLKDMILGTPSVPMNEMLSAYNDTFTEFELEPFVPVFLNQAKKYAEKTAVILEEESLTYQELDIKSTKLANYLISIGISKGDYVAVITERKLQTIINIIAILKANAAYVPIDIQYPEERQKYIINNNQCKTVLTCDIYKNENIDSCSEVLPSLSYSIKDIMYTIYTSGSTGMPKGVVETVESVINTITDINYKFNVTDRDRIIGVSSFCFDLSVYDVFASLMLGATLVMVKDQRDINHLIKTIQDQNITVWNSVPAIMNLVTQNMDKQNSSLRLIMLSGDWIPIKLPEKIHEIFPMSETISLGGATEGAIWSIYYPIKEVNDSWISIPYGMPLANQQMYVLNEQLEQCPVNVQGEICIGGLGVAQEYCGDEEKTKKAFIRHKEFGYIYRTGDYGVFRSEGYIEFLGRKDTQVKINGYRVELGEIEKCLCSVEGIKQAFVVINEDEGKAIHAFVTTDKELFTKDILDHISKYMPSYMMPKYLQIVEEFKLTPNGKIDYKALKSMKIHHEEKEAGAEDHHVMEPVTETEAEVLDLIKQVSGNASLNLNSRIFDIGIDSILLITILTKLNKKFSIDLSIEKMFRAKNIKDICHLIQTSKQGIQKIIPKAIAKNYYEMSQMQKTLYLASKEYKDNRSYNISAAIIVEGDLDIDQCQKALDQLIQRHEALRTHIKEINGTIVQQVENTLDYPISVLDSEDKGIDEIIHDNSSIFQFDEENLFNFSIIRYRSNKLLLLFEIHHIIADGMSLHILMKDFLRLYNGEQLEPLEVQFKDFVEWNEREKKTSLLSAEKQYWRNVLKGNLPKMELPRDYFVEKQRSFEGGVVELAIMDQFYHELKEFIKDTGHTVFANLFTAFNILLSHYYNSKDVIVGIPSNGRTVESVFDVVGMFVNTLPIRTEIPCTTSYFELLNQVQKSVVEGTANQNFALEDIMDKLKISGSMVYDTIFSYQYYDISTFVIQGVQFTNYNILNRASKVPLEFSITEFNDKIEINMIYSKELFLKSTVEALRDQYRQLLTYIINHSGDTVGNIIVQSLEKEKVQEESEDIFFAF